MCRKCWLERAARRLPGVTAKQLCALWKKQNGRCKYTSKRLVMGVNASIDHVLPRSRYFDSSIKNLVWADRSINHMKGDNTIEEFKRKMKTVLRRMGYAFRKKKR